MRRRSRVRSCAAGDTHDESHADPKPGEAMQRHDAIVDDGLSGVRVSALRAHTVSPSGAPDQCASRRLCRTIVSSVDLKSPRVPPQSAAAGAGDTEKSQNEAASKAIVTTRPLLANWYQTAG